MSKPYWRDLRERALLAAEAGASYHEAAEAFEVSRVRRSGHALAADRIDGGQADWFASAYRQMLTSYDCWSRLRPNRT